MGRGIKDFQLRHADKIVGGFMFCLIVAVLGVAFFYIKHHEQLRETFYVYAKQKDAEDLRKDADVLILGETVGKVTSIDYRSDRVTRDNEVMITIKLKTSALTKIYENPVIAMERRFGVGQPVLIIRRGPGSSQKLHEGDWFNTFLPEENPMDQLAREVDSVSQSIRKIQLQMNPALDSVSDSADQFSKSIRESADPAFKDFGEASQSFTKTNNEIRPQVSETLASIRETSENLDQRITSLSEKMDKLLELDMQITLRDIRAASNEVETAARRFGNTDDDVDKTLEKLSDAADEVKELANEARDVVRVVRKEADDLPGTIGNVNSTVNDTQDLVGEIRSHWLLRRYTDQSSKTKQVSPSGLRGGF